MLEEVSDRGNTVFEIAFASKDITVSQLDGARGRASQLANMYGFEYPSYVGQHPLGSRGGATETYISGELEFDREIGIELESAETEPLVKCSWIKFEKNMGKVEALLQMGVTSHPKTKWEFSVRLLDAQSKEIQTVWEKFENSGVIRGVAFTSMEQLSFPLEKALLADAKRFEVRIRERLAPPKPTKPKAISSSRVSRRDDGDGGRVELSYDDGVSGGIESIGVSGHAVIFEKPDDGLVLRAVRIYGSRYGEDEPPEEDFHVWVCDEDYNVIVDIPFSYSRFRKGEPKWVTLRVKPLEVPSTFVICTGFNPEQSKGVYVHYDDSSSGNSLIGLPGQEMRVFNRGEWMIHAIMRPGEGGDDEQSPLGKWKSVDFVKEIEDFKPGQKSWRDELHLKDVKFFKGGRTSKKWTWKDGILWHKDNRTEAKYIIKEMDGGIYMFIEWISGDVTIHGQKPSYYVMKKEEKKR